MGKNNDGLSALIKRLSSPKVGGLSFSKLLSPVDLISQTQSKEKSTDRPPLLGDVKTLSLSAKDTPTGIRFGSPSNSRTPSSQSSNQLTSLLEQTASGGIASAFSSGLGGITGIGGLVAGILNLFGGGQKTALPPLVEFQLPQPQEQTVYVSAKGSTTLQGTDVEQTSSLTPGAGIYTGAAQNTGTLTPNQLMKYQSAQIAQAVKTALLNSSSLNDVIAEI